ncbi:class I SAM-dependent methyltransferase [Paenibacillus cymbidii]|uniref:class I SAM-dependent methyltransferase n=1 Tax=Paenibacillus cymbidii TaxID=1639034 RepID=UPI001080531A|nr:class I SAM-dependent methyltransferase [Paenibacillus cymbidii]
MANTDKFEMIATIYDTPERIRIAKVSSDAIREYVADAAGKQAIDFGCGTGLVGMNLINEFHSMLFLDTSPNMIQQVKQKIANARLQHADTLCFDMEKESLADVKADYIFMAQVLLHIPDVAFVLTRLFDVLKDEGHLLIVDFDKNEAITSDIVHNGFHQAELAEIMAGIGYKQIQSKTFYHGRNLFMGQDASMFILDARK